MYGEEELSGGLAAEKQRIGRYGEKRCGSKCQQTGELCPEGRFYAPAETSAVGEDVCGGSYPAVLTAYLDEPVGCGIAEGSNGCPAQEGERSHYAQLERISAAEKLQRLHFAEIQQQTVYAGLGGAEEELRSHRQQAKEHGVYASAFEQAF